MTSDAKIGLLLGLVFIFVIAFIINGLPRFHRSTNNNELTTNMVSSQNDTQAIAEKERRAQEAFDWSQQVNKQTLEDVQPAPGNEEDVRFKIQLPQSTVAVKDVSVGITTEEVEPTIVPATTEEKTEAKEPEPMKPNLPKFYIVCEGDSLSDIAKKFYGDQEGNRKINIAKIFEANSKLLKSPDEIYVGQKLVIPPLSASTPAKDGTGGVFSSTLFEKVKSIGRKALSTESPKTEQTGFYVVREGDSLWKIAAGQLGNGSRFTEIAKLNADIIDDDDNILVGMHLRMPAR